MVHANARRIQPARRRVPHRQIRQPIAQVRAVRHRKCRQKRLQRRRSRGPQRLARHLIQHRRHGVGQPQSLIGEKEKCLVPPVVKPRDPQIAAQRAAKVVLPLRQLGRVEGVPRIQRIVAQVIERLAMPLVRPRARGKNELPARRPPIFRRIRRNPCSPAVLSWSSRSAAGGICISPRGRDGKGGSKFPATLRKNNRKRLPKTGNLGHIAYRAPCRVNALTNPSCCGQVDSISSRVAVS